MRRTMVCQACGHATDTTLWLSVDLVERPELRQEFTDFAGYHHRCGSCDYWIPRDVQLIVLSAGAAAPGLIGLPDALLGTDHPMAGRERLLDRLGEALRERRRGFPVPVFCPFDVLAMALSRDVDADYANLRAALVEIGEKYGKEAIPRYEHLFRFIDRVVPVHAVQEALQGIDRLGAPEEIGDLVARFPVLLDPEARSKIETNVEIARDGGDPIHAALAAGRLKLIQGVQAGDAIEAARDYPALRRELLGEPLADEVVQAMTAFDAAIAARDYDLAIEVGGRQLEAAARGQDGVFIAEVKVRLASAYFERRGDSGHDLERAAGLATAALATFEVHPELREQRIRALTGLGAITGARVMGDPEANQERAIALQREVLTVLDKDAEPRAWAMAHSNLALNLLERAQLGDHANFLNDGGGEAEQRRFDDLREAIDHLTASLEVRSFNNDPYDWAFTKLNLGLAYIRQTEGEPAENLKTAIAHLDGAIDGFAVAADARHTAKALSSRAHALFNLALLDGLEGPAAEERLAAAARDARAAVQAASEGDLTPDAGAPWAQLASILVARGQLSDEAVQAYHEALERLTVVAAPGARRDLCRRFGTVAADSRRWSFAADAWEAAAVAGAACVERRSTRAGRFDEMAGNVTLFRWAAYALARAGRLERALEILELGRTRELTVWLQRDLADIDAVRALDAGLAQRFVDAREAVDGHERAGTPTSDPAVTTAAEELAEVVAAIRALAPELASFRARPSLDDILHALPSDETVAYPVTTPYGSAWLVARPAGEPRVSAIDLPDLTSTAIFKAMVELDYEHDTASGFLVEQRHGGEGLDAGLDRVADLLGPRLMEPLHRDLRDRAASTLSIVAPSLLSLIPLHALAWPASAGKRCMLDDIVVTYAPSAYVRAVSIARADACERVGRLAVVGNPLPHRKPLPRSEFEAASIALTLPSSEVTALIGTDATKESVLAALPGATHVHLACHGTTATDPRELDAALSLAHERQVSGAEVLDLDLSAARLVVASACETGLNPGYHTADEALALSTMLHAAGAAGVVASLWRVYDDATSLLMTRFYEELSESRSPASALRAAQLWLRDLSVDEEAAFQAHHHQLQEQRRARGLRGVEVRDGRLVRARADDPAAPGSAGYSSLSDWAAFVFTGA